MNHLKLGGLFLFLGAVTIVSTFFLFDADVFAYEIPLGGLALGAAYVWLGFLLRKPAPSARFLALGPCLLMIIGAWVMPLVLLSTWAIGSVLAEFGPTRALFSWSRTTVALVVSVAFIYCVVMGVLGFRGLKYLRSAAGREDFRDKRQVPPAAPPFESRWVIVGSAVVFSSLLDFRVRAIYLPEFLQTRAMTEFEERTQVRARESEPEFQQRESQREIEQARVSITATFFADSRHVVLLLTGKPPRVLALDLDSGKLRRTSAPENWRNATIDNSVAAPDAAMIVSGKTTLSLITGQSRNLEAIHTGTLIGMPAPNRLLAYDETSQQLQLIDVERDAAIYSIDVPVADRGDPYGGGNAGGWTIHSQTWSLDRSRFIWLTRPEQRG